MNIIRRGWSQLPVQVRWWIKGVLNAGQARYCPICNRNVKNFLSAGLVDRRDDAKCPVCLSSERHRLAWYFMEHYTSLLDGQPKWLLHIAPEGSLRVRFKQIKHLKYLSADLSSPLAMECMDITNIQYPDDSFDAIYCSHVLEHIPDDISAMRELHRVLQPDGWVIFQVPVKGDETYEDSTIINPQERRKYFGQEDHVRIYGTLDFSRRLQQVGFIVREFRAADISDPLLIEKLQPKDQNLYYCTKP